MDPFLSYFLKVNLALIVLYGFYRLFFYRDTFLKLRRSSLLIFYIVALAYPVCNIQPLIKDNKSITEVVYIYSGMLPEITVEATMEPTNTLDFSTVFWGVYIVVIAVLLLRFLMQLFSILTIKSRKETYNGIAIRVPQKIETPFSFFKRIYINPSLHSEKELNEILTHEQTHAKQWHSVDVIISDLFARFFWINPFAWLLKREVRHNLEYLADRSVINSGHDTKTYQYHLLGLTSQKAAAQLLNNFNVLPLKRRIKMMNKKPSQNVGRLKYILFVPLVGLLLVFSNIEVLARVLTENKAQTELTDEIATINEQDLPIIASELNVENNVYLQDDTTINIRKTDPQDQTIYRGVEYMPLFPGGDSELMKFIADNIVYPKIAAENGIEGRVTVQFVVLETGEIANIEVLQKLDPALDKEAVRVVSTMPKWEPGKQNGKAVPVYYTVPIIFRLDGGKKANLEDHTVIVEEITNNGSEQAFRGVQQMPKFPGGDSELMKFLADNIKYPEEAVKNKTEGRVTIQFIVSSTGEITNIAVLQKLDPLLDKEAVRVVSSMPKWEPGIQGGKAVPVYYTVPVIFRLNKDKGNEKTDPKVTTSINDTAKSNAMPSFPGGDNAMLKYITNNIQYPVEAVKKKKQGIVNVSFAISESGNITRVEVDKKADPLLGKEVIRVFSSMPQWTPAKTDGKTVESGMSIPVYFQIMGEEKVSESSNSKNAITVVAYGEG